MPLDQFPFKELTTAAGIAAAALLIRQIIEFSKGTFFPWLDAANERKGAFIMAAVLYAAWLIFYGTNLERDLPAAIAAIYACGIAAIGTNEAVDAAKGVVAKNVVQSYADMTSTITVDNVDNGSVTQNSAKLFIYNSDTNLTTSSDNVIAPVKPTGATLSGFRSAVVYLADRKVWIATGTSGSDYSTDGGESWKPFAGGFNAIDGVFAVGPRGAVARLKP